MTQHPQPGSDAGSAPVDAQLAPGLARLLALGAAGLGIVIYLVGFFGDLGLSTLLVGPLLVGGGLLAGAVVLPKAGRVLVPGAIAITTGTLLLLQLVAAGGAPTSAVIALVVGVLQTAAVIGAALLDAGIVTAPAPRPVPPPGYGQGYGGFPPGYGQSGGYVLPGQPPLGYGPAGGHGQAGQPGYGGGQPGYTGGQPSYGDSYGTTPSGFGTSRPGAGVGQTGSGAGQPAFGATQPAFGATQPAFGTNQPGFGAQPGHARPGDDGTGPVPVAEPHPVPGAASGYAPSGTVESQDVTSQGGAPTYGAQPAGQGWGEPPAAQAATTWYSSTSTPGVAAADGPGLMPELAVPENPVAPTGAVGAAAQGWAATQEWAATPDGAVTPDGTAEYRPGDAPIPPPAGSPTPWTNRHGRNGDAAEAREPD